MARLTKELRAQLTAFRDEKLAQYGLVTDPELRRLLIEYTHAIHDMAVAPPTRQILALCKANDISLALVNYRSAMNRKWLLRSNGTMH